MSRRTSLLALAASVAALGSLVSFVGCQPPGAWLSLLQGDLGGKAGSRSAAVDLGASDLGALGSRPSRQNPLAPPLRPAQRCFPPDSSASPPRPLAALLQRTGDLIEAGRHADALVCAEEAARVDGRSILAHLDRAVCLAELNRLEESEAALLRALALDPDDPETLATAADLFVSTYTPSVDHSEVGLELARRAQKKLQRKSAKKGDKSLHGWALAIEGQALTDLGRPREALARLDLACKAMPNDRSARYSRGVALYELSRFEEALRVFQSVIDGLGQTGEHAKSDDAFHWNHLGLAKERLGDQKGADLAFAEAQRLSPADFPPLQSVSPAEFRKLVDEAVEALDKRDRTDLARAELQTADLPDPSDLTAEEPPLSPTILGLFRGLPLADLADREPRTIVLYRKNLLRATRTLGELREQIRTTLLHELGHLRGEDDDALRSRGLE